MIGNRAKIGLIFPLVHLNGKWVIHPYSPGKIRCGCFIGTYEELLARTPEIWKQKTYSCEQRDAVINIATWMQSIEHLVFVIDQKEKENDN